MRVKDTGQGLQNKGISLINGNTIVTAWEYIN